MASNIPASVNVKITYNKKIVRQNAVKSLVHLRQVIEQLLPLELSKQRYELHYIDNENDEVVLATEQCFEAAKYSAYNAIYYKNDAIQAQYNMVETRAKLVLLKIKVSEVESKYDDDDQAPSFVPVPFEFSWCSKMKGAQIALSENEMKSQQQDGSFHAVRSKLPIPKGLISVWSMDIFIDRSDSGNFYGLIAAECPQKVFETVWYNAGSLKQSIYGVDDNPGCVYQGSARIAPQWTRQEIPIKQEVKLRFTADYTKDCCALCVEMAVPPSADYVWLYQFLLPPNKEWFPAVQFEEPGSWARIENLK